MTFLNIAVEVKCISTVVAVRTNGNVTCANKTRNTGRYVYNYLAVC